MNRPASALIALSLACALGAGEASAQVRMWLDKDGVYHVEDVIGGKHVRAARQRKSKAAPAARTAKAAAPVEAPRPHLRLKWWERASDAPPDEIDRAAQLYNIPAELVRAVIWAESGGDTSVISHAGAVGLMQLMPGTAAKMYVTDPVDPAQNIQGGTRYLRSLANAFGGDMLLVLAAYNAGPEAVRKYHGVPPFAETKNYVKQVISYYYDLKRQGAQHAKKLAAAGGAGESSAKAKAPESR